MANVRINPTYFLFFQLFFSLYFAFASFLKLKKQLKNSIHLDDFESILRERINK